MIDALILPSVPPLIDIRLTAPITNFLKELFWGWGLVARF